MIDVAGETLGTSGETDQLATKSCIDLALRCRERASKVSCYRRANGDDDAIAYCEREEEVSMSCVRFGYLDENCPRRMLVGESQRSM